MKNNKYLLLLGIAAAAGAAAGVLSDRKHPAQGGLLGAAAGLLAGSVSVSVHKMLTEDDGYTYYSQSSPLYEAADDLDFV